MREAETGAASRVAAAMRVLFELVGLSPGRREDEVGRGRVHALETGSGRRLLLIHGASGGCANWYRLLPGLKRDFRVLAPDLPGFGLSAAGAAQPPLSTWTASRLLEWLDVVGWDRGDVVGTSFGGQVALRLAVSAPSRVRRLVLINATGLGREIAWLARLAALPGLRRQAASTSRAGTAWLFRRVLTTDRSLLPREHERALVAYLHTSAAINARIVRSAYRHVIGPGGQRELVTETELSSVGRETLILWGEADPFLPPAHGSRTAALLPNARFEALRGVGHSPNWERPDLVLARLRSFLLAREDAPA